jgi:hypothetical protein
MVVTAVTKHGVYLVTLLSGGIRVLVVSLLPRGVEMGEEAGLVLVGGGRVWVLIL